MNLCQGCRDQRYSLLGQSSPIEHRGRISDERWKEQSVPGVQRARRPQAKIDGLTASYRRWHHPQEVVMWLGEINAAKNWVILDTETTGSRTFSEVIEVTVISAHGQVLFSSLVNPTTEIEPLATAVHGLTRRHVKKAPRYPEIHQQLCAVLRNSLVIGYHVCFDIRLLAQTARCYQLDFPFLDVACLMYSYAKLRRCQRETQRSAICRLEVACSEMGVQQPWQHRAQTDAEAAHALLQRMIETYVLSNQRDGV
jgi:DNA polymerase-3 subunit epsilon